MLSRNLCSIPIKFFISVSRFPIDGPFQKLQHASNNDDYRAICGTPTINGHFPSLHHIPSCTTHPAATHTPLLCQTVWASLCEIADYTIWPGTMCFSSVQLLVGHLHQAPLCSWLHIINTQV